MLLTSRFLFKTRESIKELCCSGYLWAAYLFVAAVGAGGIASIVTGAGRSIASVVLGSVIVCLVVFFYAVMIYAACFKPELPDTIETHTPDFVAVGVPIEMQTSVPESVFGVTIGP